MDGSDDELAADGTLAHPLAALGARNHVAALQQHAVDGRVHADATQVAVRARRGAVLFWRETPLYMTGELTSRDLDVPGAAPPSSGPRVTPSPVIYVKARRAFFFSKRSERAPDHSKRFAIPKKLSSVFYQDWATKFAPTQWTESEKAFFSPHDKNDKGETAALTAVGVAVPVEAGDSLHQLPLLAAAFEVDKVPGQNFLQLPHAQRVHVVLAGQVRQRRPAARRRFPNVLLGVPSLKESASVWLRNSAQLDAANFKGASVEAFSFENRREHKRLGCGHRDPKKPALVYS